MIGLRFTIDALENVFLCFLFSPLGPLFLRLYQRINWFLYIG